MAGGKKYYKSVTMDTTDFIHQCHLHFSQLFNVLKLWAQESHEGLLKWLKVESESNWPFPNNFSVTSPVTGRKETLRDHRVPSDHQNGHLEKIYKF